MFIYVSYYYVKLIGFMISLTNTPINFEKGDSVFLNFESI